MWIFTCLTSGEQKCGKTKFKAIDYCRNRAYSTNLKIFTRCQLLHEDPECPTRALLDKVAHMQISIAVSVRHLNRLRATWQRPRRKGRPRHVACSAAAGGALVQITPHLSYVGVHLFAHWLDQQEAFEPVVARLQQAIEAHKSAHPADNFA